MSLAAVPLKIVLDSVSVRACPALVRDLAGPGAQVRALPLRRRTVIISVLQAGNASTRSNVSIARVARPRQSATRTSSASRCRSTTGVYRALISNHHRRTSRPGLRLDLAPGHRPTLTIVGMVACESSTGVPQWRCGMPLVLISSYRRRLVM